MCGILIVGIKVGCAGIEIFSREVVKGGVRVVPFIVNRFYRMTSNVFGRMFYGRMFLCKIKFDL